MTTSSLSATSLRHSSGNQRQVTDEYVQIKIRNVQSYVNYLQNYICMIFLAAISAEKSIAEKSVLDSRRQRQHCLQFVVCSQQ